MQFNDGNAEVVSMWVCRCLEERRAQQGVWCPASMDQLDVLNTYQWPSGHRIKIKKKNDQRSVSVVCCDTEELASLGPFLLFRNAQRPSVGLYPQPSCQLFRDYKENAWGNEVNGPDLNIFRATRLQCRAPFWAWHINAATCALLLTALWWMLRLLPVSSCLCVCLFFQWYHVLPQQAS